MNKSQGLTALIALTIAFSLPFASLDDEYDASVLDGLPKDFAWHLIHSNDSTLVCFCRKTGVDYLAQQSTRLRKRAVGLSPEDEKRKLVSILHYMTRCALVHKIEYNTDATLDECHYFENQPIEIFHSAQKLRRKMYGVYADQSITMETKIEMTDSIMHAFESLGDAHSAARARHKLSELYGLIDDFEKQFVLLRSVVADFERLQMSSITCQALGVLGVLYKQRGHIDSMIICYEKAKEIAHESRLPVQSARILTFYADHYIQTGRYAIAHDLFDEAMEICRYYKGHQYELRFLHESMNFYADLKCWEIVERLYNHTSVILDRYGLKNVEAEINTGDRAKQELIRARLLMARGDVTGSVRILEKTQQYMRNHPQWTEYVDLLLYWSAGLFENGEFEAARDRIREGLAYAEEKLLQFDAARLSIMLAKTELELGNCGNAEEALRHFTDYASSCACNLQLQWVEYYTVLARLSLLRREDDRAIEILGKSLAYLERTVAAMDGSVHAYLWLQKCEPLRMLMHDLVCDNPTLGYGVELYWRDLYKTLGSDKHSIKRTDTAIPKHDSTQSTDRLTVKPIMDELRDRAVHASRCITGYAAVHCVYLIRDDDIWRWTVSSAGIHYDILEHSARKTHSIVSETRKMLAAADEHAEKVIRPGLTGNLRMLAHTLLPPEIVDEYKTRGIRLFLVTADRFLGGIPFEAFDVGSEGAYTPLLARADVAYARFIGCLRPGPNASPGIILANTNASNELRKRYIFQRPLSEAKIEAERAAGFDPGAILLTGESATKARLTAAWENASYLYFATHTLSDPEVPYLVHIPLAHDSNRVGIEETYLDVTDIRSADLGRCGLVVLSGCSSGVPYVEVQTDGPSLGDAFLDSGAGAVIQTFWDVRDDEARDLMTSFITLSNGMRSSPVRTLCEVKRRAMHGPNGISHPVNWASYSIELGALPVD